MLLGKKFFKKYLGNINNPAILDIGSLDVNGSLRTVAPKDCDYIGLDTSLGRGVDVVTSDPHHYEFLDNKFDAIVSTSCFEHDTMFWLTFLEMLRVIKYGGYIYINVPSNGGYHAYPVDCWRFYPDSGKALESWGRKNGFPVNLCESFTAYELNDTWNDYVMVFQKGEGNRPNNVDLISTTGGGENIRIKGKGELLNPHVLPRDIRFNLSFCTRIYKSLRTLASNIRKRLTKWI